MKIAYLSLAAALHGLEKSSARSDTTLRNGQPLEIHSEDGLLQVTLNVDLVETTELNRLAPGYNGGPVGPTLRAKPGDKVRITLNNNLQPSSVKEVELSSFAMTPVVEDEEEKEEKELNQTLLVNRLAYPTGNVLGLPREDYWGKSFQNLHFHGIMVDPTIDDSRVYIDGGQQMVYEFDISEDSPPLFGFYHNHVHGTATYSFLSGLYGVFVVEDAVSHPLPSYIASTPQTSEQFLLLSESHVSEDKTPVDFIDIVMAFNWKHVTNGRLSPTMTFKRNERVHFRAVNAGVEPAVALSIENHKLILYAMDGYPVPEPEELDSVTLDAGVRAEFFVKFDTPGTFQFKRAPWNMGITGSEMCVAVFGIDADKCISYDEERDVGTIVVLDEEVESDLTVDDPIAIPAKTRSSSKPAMDPYLKNLLKLPKAGSREITFEEARGYPIFQIPYNGSYVAPGYDVGFGINNRLFNPHYFHGDIKRGTCEEWTVKAAEMTTPIHSFHSHTGPFYVTAMDGLELDDSSRFWRDTMVTSFNFTATVCFPPHDAESYVNVHCHMPHHQDVGMAAFYRLLPADSTDEGADNEDPNEDASSSLKLGLSIVVFFATFSTMLFL